MAIPRPKTPDRPVLLFFKWFLVLIKLQFIDSSTMKCTKPKLLCSIILKTKVWLQRFAQCSVLEVILPYKYMCFNHKSLRLTLGLRATAYELIFFAKKRIVHLCIYSLINERFKKVAICFSPEHVSAEGT